MPETARLRMEAMFGTNLATVRIHQDDQASKHGARAFARGEDVFFAPGEYDPMSPGGAALLAHELTHVVQQREGRARGNQASGAPWLVDDPALEAEADLAATRVGASPPMLAPPRPVTTSGGLAVIQRMLVNGSRPPQPEDLRKKLVLTETQEGHEFFGTQFTVEQIDGGRITVRSRSTEKLYAYVLATGTYEEIRDEGAQEKDKDRDEGKGKDKEKDSDNDADKAGDRVDAAVLRPDAHTPEEGFLSARDAYMSRHSGAVSSHRDMQIARKRVTRYDDYSEQSKLLALLSEYDRHGTAAERSARAQQARDQVAVLQARGDHEQVLTVLSDALDRNIQFLTDNRAMLDRADATAERIKKNYASFVEQARTPIAGGRHMVLSAQLLNELQDKTAKIKDHGLIRQPIYRLIQGIDSADTPQVAADKVYDNIRGLDFNYTGTNSPGQNLLEGIYQGDCSTLANAMYKALHEIVGVSCTVRSIEDPAWYVNLPIFGRAHDASKGLAPAQNHYWVEAAGKVYDLLYGRPLRNNEYCKFLTADEGEIISFVNTYATSDKEFEQVLEDIVEARHESVESASGAHEETATRRIRIGILKGRQGEATANRTREESWSSDT